MKSIGIVRNVDELGRVVIPKETRDILNISQSDALEIFCDEKAIYLKKYAPGCAFCNTVDKLTSFKGVYICDECRKSIIAEAEDNK